MTLVKSQVRGTEQPKKRKKEPQEDINRQEHKSSSSSWEMSAHEALKVNFVDSEL